MANLNELLKPGQPLPSGDTLLKKAFDILDHSPHGQHLIAVAQESGLKVKMMANPQPITYLPDPRIGYIGFNQHQPFSLSSFILMLVGLMRESQQEINGIRHPSIEVPYEEHVNASMAKYEDKMWHMCKVAEELDAQDTFSDFKFMDELVKMGHGEIVAVYLKQEKTVE